MTAPALDITTMVNGEVVRLDLAPEVLLLDTLRDELGLLGAKLSCDVAVCGACRVLLDGLPVSACTTLAWEARGRSILTIEGLAGAGGLHPLQQAFLVHGALQCGFCTPGMILAAKALLDSTPHPRSRRSSSTCAETSAGAEATRGCARVLRSRPGHGRSAPPQAGEWRE